MPPRVIERLSENTKAKLSALVKGKEHGRTPQPAPRREIGNAEAGALVRVQLRTPLEGHTEATGVILGHLGTVLDDKLRWEPTDAANEIVVRMAESSSLSNYYPAWSNVTAVATDNGYYVIGGNTLPVQLPTEQEIALANMDPKMPPYTVLHIPLDPALPNEYPGAQVAYPLNYLLGSVINSNNPTGAQLFNKYNFTSSLYGVTEPQEHGHSEPNYEGKTRSLTHVRLLSEEGALLKCRWTPNNGNDSYGNPIPPQLLDAMNISTGSTPTLGSYVGCRSDGTLGSTAVWMELLWWVARKANYVKRTYQEVNQTTGAIEPHEYWVDPCTDTKVTRTTAPGGAAVPEPLRGGRSWIAPWGWWKTPFAYGGSVWFDNWWNSGYGGTLWNGYYGWFGGWGGYYGYDTYIPSEGDVAGFLDIGGTPPTLPPPCWKPTIHVHGIWGYLTWTWGWQVVAFDPDDSTVTVRGGKPLIKMERVVTDIQSPDITQYDD